MPQLPQPKPGAQVRIRHKPVPFSYWPTRQGAKREKLQSTLFATDPWGLIERSIAGKLAVGSVAVEQGLAFARQAQDFYRAASGSDVSAAKPLLLYYCFLNLAKAFVVYKNGAQIVGPVMHGLSEKLASTGNVLEGGVNTAGGNSAFALFTHALGRPAPPPAPAAGGAPTYASRDFLSQILIGHRLFCQGAEMIERFVSLDRLEVRQLEGQQELYVWGRLLHDDLQRLGYYQTNLINRGGFGPRFRSVGCLDTVDGRDTIAIEEIATHPYPQRPSEIIKTVTWGIRPHLWRSVTANAPYRKYYAYISSQNQLILDQLQSLYIATYFFGSITRYKPEHFRSILAGPMGTFVAEFFVNQPPQFLYLMASEFAEQEVARAAIV